MPQAVGAGPRSDLHIPQAALLQKPGFVLAAIFIAFLSIECLLPLATAVKIGADEGFELAKAMLCSKGYHLYTEIWNDQPPLNTFLVTQILEHVSTSVLAPRLMIIFFSAVLLGSVFTAALRVHGLPVAALAAMLVIASPGFLELSCSVMQEIPGLALALAALAVLIVGRSGKTRLTEIVSGLLLGMALQVKFIELVYLPVAGLILFLRSRKRSAQILAPPPKAQVEDDRVKVLFWFKPFFLSLLAFVASLATTFVLLDFLLGGHFWLQFRQSWAAHFAAPVSSEYGSPDAHAFDWTVLLKIWDTSLPAMVGIVLSIRRWKQIPLGMIPVAWLILTLVVVENHKPWWTYYYIHSAIPLCWCGALGATRICQYVFTRRGAVLRTVFGAFAVGAAIWMGSRLSLQIIGIRNSPRIFSSLVLQEIQRLKPFTKFIYTDEPVYSFHSGIPLPPELGVVSLKRFWSGDLSNARLVDILVNRKPGLVLWHNETGALPFDPLLQTDYRLIYEDPQLHLYARTEVLEQAKQSSLTE